MNETRLSARDFAKTMSNAEKVVFNEVQKNFFRKESAYFGSVDMNYPCGGSKIDMKQFYDSPAVADPTAGDLRQRAGDLCQQANDSGSANGAHKATKTEKLVQIKGVGFDLLYTRDGCSSQEPSIKKINVETPCKVIMAMVLVAYIMNRHMQPADEVDSFFGAILDACKCALCSSTPLGLANWWFGSAGRQSKEQELPKVESPTSKYGDLWKANVWLRKFTGSFGRSLSSSASAAPRTAPTPRWTDKMGSLFKRIRTWSRSFEYSACLRMGFLWKLRRFCKNVANCSHPSWQNTLNRLETEKLFKFIGSLCTAEPKWRRYCYFV